jgi:hypothetical protein
MAARGSRPARRPSRWIVALAVALLVAGCASATPVIPARTPSAVVDGSASRAGSADAAVVALEGAAPSMSAAPSGEPAASGDRMQSSDPSASAAPTFAVPLVPVTGFWSAERGTTRAALARLLAGAGTRHVFVAEADLPRLAAALGVAPGASVRAMSPAAVRSAIAADPAGLGILRPDDVTPAVRALAVDGASLFGTARLRDLARWPLLVSEPAGSAPSAYDAGTTWTLVAGGDVMLDRYVYRRTVIDRLGADYPWSGGNAKVVSTLCCGYPGFRIVRAATAGSAGSVRDYLRSADIALVNLEGPAPSNFRYHPSGLVFSMDPRLLVGLAHAGVDVVSLGNNHIRNWGGPGVLSTVRNLDALGIRHAGAGANAAVARRPAWLTAAGLRIAILAYNGVGTAPNATSRTAGAAALSLAAATADIRAARAAGADVVIVVPHWGAEYTDRLTAQQASLGPALLRAGADAVLGGHSHWAGPVRVIGSRVVVYSMGDFIFDLVHDTRTQEGMLVELTFAGRRLAQVQLRPTVIVGGVQPGFLLPAYGGTTLLRAIRVASAAAGMR